ncbi:hypothetical protein FM106_07530 [Brachybacterium faecium]|nr:hypothetical protein FM106_07530 [Brachybacterium faecium]
MNKLERNSSLMFLSKGNFLKFWYFLWLEAREIKATSHVQK